MACTSISDHRLSFALPIAKPQIPLIQGGCKNATKKVNFYLGVLVYEGTCEALDQAQDLIRGRDMVHRTSELVGQSSGTER